MWRKTGWFVLGACYAAALASMGPINLLARFGWRR